MTGAICGGARYLWKTEDDPKPRWCFGERKRLPGRWELWSDNPKDISDIPFEELSWWEPFWRYRCSGCGDDRRSGGFFEARDE